MSEASKIPQVDFPNRQKKSFEFEINHSKTLLHKEIPMSFNPYTAHRVSFYVIVFIVNGEGNHFIDFKQYPFKRGTLLFISKEQVQFYQKIEGVEAYYLIFTEKFLERSQLETHLMQQLTLFNYHLFEPTIQLDDKDFPLFLDLVKRIFEEYYAPDDFATEEIIKSSLNVFLCLAERIRQTKLDTQARPYYYEDFLRLQKLLKKYLFEDRSVQFYAQEMAISAKKLNRITYEIVQQPAKTYISQMLILEIKRYLVNTNLSVKEIAYQIGFEAPTNLVKFFRNQEKITPAEFRKRYLAKV